MSGEEQREKSAVGGFIVQYSYRAFVSGSDETAARLAVMQRHAGAAITSITPVVPGPMAAIEDAYPTREWLHNVPEEAQGHDVTLTRREIGFLADLVSRASRSVRARHRMTEPEVDGLQFTMYNAEDEAEEAEGK